MKSFVFLLVLATALQAQAQGPTELYDCVDDSNGPDFCTTDSTTILEYEGCGATFNQYQGRIAWPVLWNAGPITISVKTHYKKLEGHLPLFVEVRGRNQPEDPLDCRTGLGGVLILVAEGSTDCTGAWESVGPIDLDPYGVRLGAPYQLQAVFFQGIPNDYGYVALRTIGFSCIRVTSHPTAVATTTWGNVKQLYR